MRINREEIFGRGASVIRINAADAGLGGANVTPFDLSAGADPHVPFGGRKGYSCGPREPGRCAAGFFTSVKTAQVNP